VAFAPPLPPAPNASTDMNEAKSAGMVNVVFDVEVNTTVLAIVPIYTPGVTGSTIVIDFNATTSDASSIV
jgi:hypothetical protein